MIEFIQHFAETYVAYIRELLVPVGIGFLISGFLNEYTPAAMVERHLGTRSIKAIFIASLVGMMLPVCCFGSLPIAVTLQKKGARLGPVLAFLVATPATSVSALIVCWKLLGGVFTLYIFCAVIIMGLIMGIAGNRLHVDSSASAPTTEAQPCCHTKHHAQDTCPHAPAVKVKNIFRYAFITLPKEIGIDLLVGVAIASAILIAEPVQRIIAQFLTGGAGYAFSLIAGISTYVCSTASVPMAHALLYSGMAAGAVMVYLLVGPITSYGALLVLKKTFGLKVLAWYLVIICVTSLGLGIGFQILTSSVF